MSSILNDWRNAPLGKALGRVIQAWWLSLNTPNPWPDELDEQVHAIDALPVCHRCFLPFEYHSQSYFCTDCGASIGPFNNYLPLHRYYAVGEVMRSAVGPEAVLTIPCIIGYVLFMSSRSSLFLLPFVFRLCRNIDRLKTVTTDDTIDRRASAPLIALAILLVALPAAFYLAIFWPLHGDGEIYPREYPYEEVSTEVEADTTDTREHESYLQLLNTRQQNEELPQTNAFYSFEVDIDPPPPLEGGVVTHVPPRDIPEKAPVGNLFTYDELQENDTISAWTQRPAKAHIETIVIPFP